MAENEALEKDKAKYDDVIKHHVKRKGKVAGQLAEAQRKMQEESRSVFFKVEHSGTEHHFSCDSSATS